MLPFVSMLAPTGTLAKNNMSRRRAKNRKATEYLLSKTSRVLMGASPPYTCRFCELLTKQTFERLIGYIKRSLDILEQQTLPEHILNNYVNEKNNWFLMYKARDPFQNVRFNAFSYGVYMFVLNWSKAKGYMSLIKLATFRRRCWWQNWPSGYNRNTRKHHRFGY